MRENAFHWECPHCGHELSHRCLSSEPSEPLASACWDCGVAIGQPHDDGCDVARCLFNGSQRLSCDGGAGHNIIFEVCGIDHTEELHDCGQDIHDGVWPGEADAIRLGWYRPDGQPDLNRLAIDGRWTRDRHRWEERT